MALYEEGTAASVPMSRKAGLFANVAGGAVSLALMAGIGVWGYQLIMRDVSGIPVVRAMEGAMRVAPDNPGGEVAAHTGLAVNAVAAEGGAAPTEETLVLAPEVSGLREEDLMVQPMAEADEVAPVEPDVTADEVQTALVEDEETPLSLEDPDDILALVDQLAAGAEPMAPLDGDVVEPTVLLDGEEVETLDIIARTVPGVVTSLRPTLRPNRGTTTEAVATALAAATAAPAEVTTRDLPVGTKLVQLGAFPSPDAAAAEWGVLQNRFSEFFQGKERLILQAERNGQAFYRLRAAGFADLSDARRFCASLEAGNADCIPVVVR